MTMTDPAAPATGNTVLGKRRLCKEDRALLTGEAKYTNDLNIPGALHLAVHRSPYAHARIIGVDLTAAAAAPGVVAAYSGVDLAPLWDGQPKTSNLAEYLVPAASDVPSITLGHTITPSPTNPLGVKGVGEAGTIGATPAVINAIVDALSGLGVTEMPMPASPYNVWKTIQSARSSQSTTAQGATK